MTVSIPSRNWFAGVLAIAGIVVCKIQAAEPDPVSQPVQSQSSDKEAPTDKSSYTFFNPVPRALLRDLGTDRPDQTEGPYTVDAGHVQIESDLVNYFYDRKTPGPGKVTSQSVDVGDMNVRIGLLNFLEADVIVYPYIWERAVDRTSHDADEREGFGDTTLRMKVNFFGNDKPDNQQFGVAVGLMPYVKIPTNSGHLANHYVEGGVIFPIDVTLPDTWSIALMTEGDIVHNFEGAGYHAQWVNSLVVHRDIIRDKLNVYGEYYSALSAGKHIGPLETVDGGFLWAITKDVQLDVGINVGVSKRAPDYNPFLGLSVRF